MHEKFIYPIKNFASWPSAFEKKEQSFFITWSDDRGIYSRYWVLSTAYLVINAGYGLALMLSAIKNGN